MKRLIIFLMLAVAGLSVPASAVPSLGWWNEGDPNTTHQHWDFTPGHVNVTGNTATPESVISPNPGAVLATITPIDTWDGETKFTARTYLSVSLTLPNYDILNPLKVVWVDIGNAKIDDTNNISISASGHDIPSTEYIYEVLPWQGDAEFGVMFWPNPETEVITMFFGPGTVLDYVHVDTICIPEPTTVALLGLGALSLLRRKK